MLNIGRMAPGGEDYYLATVADGVEEYYLGKGELPGRWVGGGSTGLGLSGRVFPEELRAVLGARDPGSDEVLLDQRQRKVPGFDLTFRAPKSVSLLYGLCDTEVSDEVRRAHDAAVDAALGYLEREAIWSRRGKGGADRIPTTGAVAAAFMHRTSRAGDPLLHTHVLVANLGQADDDGCWRTLDSRRIYAHAKTAGYLYQTHLRHELTRRLHLTWQPVVRGTADLRGIDREVIEAFSQRRAQILQLMADRGESSARAAQVATLDTRQPKDHDLDTVGLRERWCRQARDLGLDPDRLLHNFKQAALRAPDRPDLGVVAERLAGPDGLTAQASTFSRRDVLQAWCDQLPAGLQVAQVEQLADALLDLSAGAVVGLDDPDSRVRRLTRGDVIRTADDQRAIPAVPDDGRYSTPELLTLEQRQVSQATARQSAGVAHVDNQHVEQALAVRPSITGEQAEMVRRLATSGAGVEVVIGKAGAGKTFALDAARAAWQAAGVRVIGTALAARAAVELEASAGIDSYTLDRLLADVEHPDYGGLARGSVVVVDEAGMVGTRRLGRLLDAAGQVDAKVVLVGDPHQLPEIDAGGLLRGLAHRLPVIELTDNRRQHAGWERDALDQLRDGDVHRAVQLYRAHDRIVVGDTADAVREQLVGDWWHARTETELDGVMVAARRTDVEDLNARARGRMAAAGELTGPTVAATDRVFQAGDRIVCLRNNRRFGVVNGTRATVLAVDPDGRSLTAVEDRTGTRIELPGDYLDAGHVHHAYAVTAHKAQGLTTEATWVLGSDALYREWGYVALSRGRQTNHLYMVAGHEPDGASHETALEDAADPVRRLATDLARSRGQHLAINQATTTAFAELTNTDLREQRRRLREAVLEPVRQQLGNDRQRTHLELRHNQLTQQRDRLTAELHDAQDEFSASRRRHRKSQRAVVDKARAALSVCDGQLAAVTTQLGDLAAATPATPEAAGLETFVAAEWEFDRRAHDHAVADAFAPPEYVLGVLGPRPDSPAGRWHWFGAIEAIERYRTAWSIDHPTAPLGDRPTDLTQRREHDALAALLIEARQRLLDQPAPQQPTRDMPVLARA